MTEARPSAATATNAPPQVAVLGARHSMPHSPDVCPPRLSALIQRCWSTEPRRRPLCSEVVAELEALLLQETPADQ